METAGATVAQSAETELCASVRPVPHGVGIRCQLPAGHTGERHRAGMIAWTDRSDR